MYVMHNIIWANQKTESFVFHWLHAHSMIDIMCFHTFVISRVLLIRQFLPSMLTVALRDIRAKWLLYQERFSQLGLTLLTEPFTPLSDTDELHVVCHVSQKLCPQLGSYRLSVMKKQVKDVYLQDFPLWKICMFIYRIFHYGKFVCLFIGFSIVENLYVYLQDFPLWKICMFIYRNFHYGKFICLFIGFSTMENLYVYSQDFPLWKICMFIHRIFHYGKFVCFFIGFSTMEHLYVCLQDFPLWKICMFVYRNFHYGKFICLFIGISTMENLYVYLQGFPLWKIYMFIYRIFALWKIYMFIHRIFHYGKFICLFIEFSTMENLYVYFFKMFNNLSVLCSC